MEKTRKYVYFFGKGKAEGKDDQKALLGGKGAGLAEMTNIGLPVPGGFTLTTDREGLGARRSPIVTTPCASGSTAPSSARRVSFGQAEGWAPRRPDRPHPPWPAHRARTRERAAPGKPGGTRGA